MNCGPFRKGNSIGGEVANQLAVDSIGNLFVAGAFNGNSTSLGSYNFNNSHSGLNDLFIENFHLQETRFGLNLQEVLTRIIVKVFV
ncbi:MAG: hypothetical protein IPP38_12150 [Bacteroidetes bacterium]|nr:hypothetical protein [Bacteroidota bacterium]